MSPHRIEGSKLWRVWCCECGEPMRDNESAIHMTHYCDDCWPHERWESEPTRKDVVYEGWRENAVRALEESA